MIKTKTGEKRDFHLSDKAFRMYYGGCRSAEKKIDLTKKKEGENYTKTFFESNWFSKMKPHCTL